MANSQMITSRIFSMKLRWISSAFRWVSCVFHWVEFDHANLRVRHFTNLIVTTDLSYCVLVAGKSQDYRIAPFGLKKIIYLGQKYINIRIFSPDD